MIDLTPTFEEFARTYQPQRRVERRAVTFEQYAAQHGVMLPAPEDYGLVFVGVDIETRRTLGKRKAALARLIAADELRSAYERDVPATVEYVPMSMDTAAAQAQTRVAYKRLLRSMGVDPKSEGWE